MSEQIASAADDSLLGVVLGGRYEIESKLGEGAMGAVYLVRDRETGEQLALNRIVQVSGLVRWLRRCGWCAKSPAEKIETPRCGWARSGRRLRA